LPRKTDSNNAADWIYFAASDLEAIRVCAQAEVGYPLCRSKLAEVVEKLLKAELLRLGWFLEKTHDIEKLSGELRVRGSDVLPLVDTLGDELTDAYFSDRYPGFDLEDADWPSMRRMLDQVDILLKTIESRV
jgi:HEPN domain-containing protein